MSLQRRDDFAHRCGTTYAFLRNVMYGQRIAGEKLCVRIERESGGAVTRQDLRRDWREIWPELDPSLRAA
nr:helix-turn-helix domain-containing protein [Paraburkholderia unamae]